MLGLGLSGYIPYFIYGLAFVVALLVLFHRSEIGILFLVPLFPAYSLLNKVLKSDLPFANNVVDMVIVGMLMGWLLRGTREQEEAIGTSPMLVPVLILAGYTLLSFVLSAFNFDYESNYERFAHWKNYMIAPILYLITFYNLKERKWKNVLLISLAVMLLASEYKFKQTLQWYDTSHFYDKSRLQGTFGYLGPNEWGSFNAMVSLCAVGLFLIDKHVWRRVLYALLFWGGTYAAMYSYSRGAYIGFTIGLIIIAAVKAKKLLIPIIILLLMWKSVLPLSVGERIEMTLVGEDSGLEDVVTVGGTSIHTAGRAHLWEDAVTVFSGNPITGSGYNTYQRMKGWDTHSLYFKTLAEQGIIGITILLWLFYLALRSGWRLYRESEETFIKALGFGFFCAALGAVLVNFFGDRWTYLQIGGIFWVLWAMVDQEYSMLKAKETTADA